LSERRLHEGDAAAREWRRQWELPPGVAYLNHGSFGLSPRPVLDAWTGWIRRIDKNRGGFYRREAKDELAAARSRLAGFLGTAGDNIVFTPNTTMAMLAIAGSFPLAPGDEVFINDHEYWSVIEIWRRACEKAGAKLVVTSLPVPAADRETLVEQLFAEVTPAAKLIIFSHITYRTSVVMPAAEICRRARRNGIAVLIDGAHAIVQRPVDIDALDCDFYAASCHKWLCAPAGAGFLYVHPRARAMTGPLTGRLSGTWRDAAFHGTQDYSRYLAVPAAIDFIESAGLDYFRERTHALARFARHRVSEATGLAPWFPDSAEWYASMVALELPPIDERALRDALWRDFRIESYVSSWNDRPMLRISCHLYTEAAEIDRLVEALESLGIRGAHQ